MILGITWIYGSDRILLILLNLQSINELTQYQSYKGVIYVIFTSWLLFLLIKNSTHKLQSSGNFYKSYFEQNPNPMWLIDSASQKILAVNNAACKVYGYTQQEFLMMSMHDIRMPGEQDIQWTGNNAAGIDTLNPGRHIKKNGELIYVDVFTHYTTRKNKPVAFIMAIDITRQVDFEQTVTELNRTLEDKVNERTRQYLDKNYALEVANLELSSLNEELTTANEKLETASNIIAQQAELLVKQSEDKLNNILTTIQDVVWSSYFVNRELNFINQAAKQVLGYSPDELYQNGSILESMVYREDKKLVEMAFKELIARKYFQAEYRIVHQSGEIRWIRNRVWLKTDEAGQPSVMDGVITDITDRKNYEAELQKREILLSSLIDSQTNYLVRINSRGNYTFANQQFLKDIGYSSEELLGQPASLTISPDELPDFQTMVQECILNPGKIVPLLFSTTGRKGDMHWSEWEFIGIHDETGRVAEIQGVGHNITERKKSEEQLEEYTRTLQEAQQVAQIGNWAFNIYTGEAIWSDQVFAIHHLSKSNGAPPLQELAALYHPDDWPLLQAAINTAVEQGLPYNLDLRIVDQVSREIMYVNVIGKPIHDKNGKVVKLYGTILNVNERKLFEKNLQHQNEQLRKINAELDKFVYSVSHSLRAPLTSVLGLINVIRITEVDPQTDTYLGLIEKSVRKLDGTLHEINDYSRNARLGLNVSEIDFPALLQNLKAQYSTFEGIQITIETSLQADHPFYSDEERVQVVLNNILTNACKYRDDKKSPHVALRVRVTKEAALIGIEDNGIGIDPEYINKIFNMFFRASERSTGSGLGLYIVKETLDKLKGDIDVASEPGKGSVFNVRLTNIHS
ncbi:PAS domain S-box protein [Rhodocytophaga aerolata]|uniref:histidine kinase n=1 Tax=Rhodocytophaga aerolata TaxID=455078 RepID=A0ABT8R1M2_9BACT|nr:PAS domain S-box protein [Rhodocytophaga aerolata]MDO1445208.1 PAS domain S-box protein [Rhodocytophaga aerolata]